MGWRVQGRASGFRPCSLSGVAAIGAPIPQVGPPDLLVCLRTPVSAPEPVPPSWRCACPSMPVTHGIEARLGPLAVEVSRGSASPANDVSAVRGGSTDRRPDLGPLHELPRTLPRRRHPPVPAGSLSNCAGRRKGASRPCGMGLRPTLPPGRRSRMEAGYGERGDVSVDRPGLSSTVVTRSSHVDYVPDVVVRVGSSQRDVRQEAQQLHMRMVMRCGGSPVFSPEATL